MGVTHVYTTSIHVNASTESTHWLPGVLTPEKILRPVQATGWSAMEEEMTRFQRMTDLWDNAPGGALVARTYIYNYIYIIFIYTVYTSDG